MELEEKMRAEILSHMKQREGDGPRNLDEINLDDDYMSEVESRSVMRRFDSNVE